MGWSALISRLLRRTPPEAPVPRAELRDYALSELGRFDGADPARPILIAIRGQVYDVTRGRAFYGPGGPYGMFAGRDCTRALAKVSFDDGLFTGDESGLELHELDQLEEWIETFEGKYDRVGSLIENA